VRSERTLSVHGERSCRKRGERGDVVGELGRLENGRCPGRGIPFPDMTKNFLDYGRIGDCGETGMRLPQ